MAAAKLPLPVHPTHPQRDESRRIDNLIGSLLHSLDILGTANLRVAAELEAFPLTIDEVLEKSRRAQTSTAVADPSRKRE
jgi:hypothetical protein